MILAAEEEEMLAAGGGREEVLYVDDDDEPGTVADETLDIDVTTGNSDVAPIAAPPPSAPAASPSIPPDVAREAQIARLLTECDVFSRYGLRSKVLEQLQRVIEIAPEHVEARERL